MRKHFTLLAVILLIALSLQVFAGCSNGSGNGDTTTTTTVTSTVTTTSATTTTTTTTKKDDGSGDSTPDTQTTKDEGDLKDPITTTSPDEGQPDDPIIPGTTQGSDTDDNPDIPATTTTKKQENQDPDTDDQPATADGVDLVLFIGQSNMAGRGSSTKATVVEESHAYEFRAISDPTKLYPVKEPFGATENNSASGVTESKKTGSLVSAFCESYYAATGTPIVAVSCSKGGEKISFFDTSTKVYADAVSRMKAAKAYLDGEYAKGNTQFKVKNVYVVWLQGESDADNNTSTSAYTAALSRIVAGFKKDIGCDQTFVIPIGTYNGNDGALKAKYNTIRDTQILFCQDNPDATVICTQLADLHRFGYMKDQYHFHQEGYEIIGKDAGANMAFFTENGKKPVCQPYFEEENAVRENGAWQEENGKVVIPASAAAERSNYANFSSSGENYSFAAVSGTLEGIKNTNANGKYWDNITYAFFSAPSVHYTVNFKTAGRYYIYLLTSYPDTGSNSVYVNIDDGELVACANNSFGSGKWMSDQTWYLDITAR